MATRTKIWQGIFLWNDNNCMLNTLDQFFRNFYGYKTSIYTYRHGELLASSLSLLILPRMVAITINIYTSQTNTNIQFAFLGKKLFNEWQSVHTLQCLDIESEANIYPRREHTFVSYIAESSTYNLAEFGRYIRTHFLDYKSMTWRKVPISQQNLKHKSAKFKCKL